MGFLFPAVLGGLAAVSIPIAIHLLNKLRVRNIDWAAMRFLQESLRKNERRVKLEDLILLILRCLFVALLVFAFARPVLRALASGNEGGSGPVTAVVLLDNSASMTQGNSVETRFEKAKKDILQWLDTRDGQSLTALYLVSNRTQAVIPRPQSDRALFRKMLETAKPGDRGTDLAQGIRQAYQAVENAGGSNLEIRVYSDSQTTGWTGLDEIRTLVAEHPNITLRPVPVGNGGENNLGLIGLRPDGGVPSAGQPCRMRVEIGNYGTQPAENILVSLDVDGSPAGESLFPPIAPGTTQAMDVVITFQEPGPHAVTARIPPDAFALDNERAVALNVIRRMNVLIVEGTPSPASSIDRDGYFLANALVPLPRDRTSQYYLATSFAGEGDLNARLLSECEVVFFANPGDIPSPTTQLLRDYVAQGGSIVIFPGPQTNPAQWKQNAAWTDLLPATLEPLKVAEGARLPSWQSGDYEHPVTALWNDSAQGSLGSVKFTQYFPLTLKQPAAAAVGQAAAGPPAVIVRLANGDPAAVEWKYGQGRVVLFNSTATPEWTNLPLHRGFVALLQRLMGYLNLADQGRLVLAPGETFVMAAPPEWRGREFSVQSPGKDSVARVAGQVAFDDGKAYIRYSGTEATGAYKVFLDKEAVAAFAVQLPPRESDLRQLEARELESLVKAPAPRETKPPVKSLVVKKEFWTTLIWIALAVAIMESVLAYRFSQAR